MKRRSFLRFLGGLLGLAAAPMTLPAAAALSPAVPKPSGKWYWEVGPVEFLSRDECGVRGFVPWSFETRAVIFNEGWVVGVEPEVISHTFDLSHTPSANVAYPLDFTKGL